MKFLAQHRRAIHAAFLICASLTTIMLCSGCAGGSFLSDLESVIPVAITGITGILNILATVDPAIAPEVAVLTPIALKIKADLTTVKSLQEEYKANADEGTLADIESLITTTTNDLATLMETNGLPAAEAAQIQAVAVVLSTQLQALISMLPVLQASTAGQTLTVTKPSTTADFKAKIAVAATPAEPAA